MTVQPQNGQNVMSSDGNSEGLQQQQPFRPSFKLQFSWCFFLLLYFRAGRRGRCSLSHLRHSARRRKIKLRASNTTKRPNKVQQQIMKKFILATFKEQF
jgi:hypothetical protein